MYELFKKEKKNAERHTKFKEVNMPATKLQEKARKKYVTVNEFRNQYSLSKPQAYKILAMPEMKEAIMKVGKKGKRVDLDLAFEIMQKIFE